MQRITESPLFRPQHVCSFILTVLLLGISPFQTGCTWPKSKKSGLRDLAGGDTSGAASALKEMTMKYSFIHIGTGGKRYPVYMNADLRMNESGQEAVWNSRIDSDGGLISAIDESKTIKPDTQLAMKVARSASQEGTETYVFTSGNPELGRGLSLKVQQVNVAGQLTWKATALSYFGNAARIEDSHAPSFAAVGSEQKNQPR